MQHAALLDELRIDDVAGKGEQSDSAARALKHRVVVLVRPVVLRRHGEHLQPAALQRAKRAEGPSAPRASATEAGAGSEGGAPGDMTAWWPPPSV